MMIWALGAAGLPLAVSDGRADAGPAGDSGGTIVHEAMAGPSDAALWLAGEGKRGQKAPGQGPPDGTGPGSGMGGTGGTGHGAPGGTGPGGGTGDIGGTAGQ